MKDYAQTLSNIGENKYFKWDGSIFYYFECSFVDGCKANETPLKLNE